MPPTPSQGHTDSPGCDGEPTELARSRQRCRGWGEQQHPSHTPWHRRGCPMGAVPGAAPRRGTEEQEEGTARF